MKKILFITGIILLFTLPHFSSDFSVSLSVNYNHGTSDFFQKSQLFLTYNGLSFIEKKHNQMGMGFNLSVCVPIMKKLYIVPGFNLGIGHQVHEFPENYEESNVDPNTNNMQRQN